MADSIYTSSQQQPSNTNTNGNTTTAAAAAAAAASDKPIIVTSTISKDKTSPKDDCDNNDADDNSDASSCYVPTYENELIDLPSPSPYDNGNNDKKYKRHQFEVLTVVPPPLEYMMSLHSEEREISGRQVWCGSFMLAAFLLWKEQQQEDVVCDKSGGGCEGGSVICGRRVLELGSGTGILGMLASRLRPTLVAITDGDSTAIDNLRRNLSNPANEINGCVAKVCPLSWGNATNDDCDDDNEEDRKGGVDEDGVEVMTSEGGGDYGGGWREFHCWCRASWPDVYPSVHDGGGTVEKTARGSGGWSKEKEIEEKGKEKEGVGISNSDVFFDCILAGDVIYKPNLPKIFFQTVVQHLAPSPSPRPSPPNNTADRTRNNHQTPPIPASLYLCHVPRAGITHPIVRTAAHNAGLDIVKEWDVGDLGGEKVLFGREEDYGKGDEVDTEEAVVELDDVRRARVYCMRVKVEQ